MSNLEIRRICTWCRGPIDPSKRSDAKTCSKACRQSAHRFRVAPAAPATGRAMRFGYADPPYPGLAWKYYRCDEVDHADLIESLEWDYPDGWALSTSTDALQEVLALCPKSVRVCPWVRGPRIVKSFRARCAWEPLLVARGRLSREDVAADLCDVLLEAASARSHSHPDAIVGMKPASFAEWMFRMLGAEQGDTLDDLFPGSGSIGRAWSLFQSGEQEGEKESRLAGSTRRLFAAVASSCST